MPEEIEHVSLVSGRVAWSYGIRCTFLTPSVFSLKYLSNPLLFSICFNIKICYFSSNCWHWHFYNSQSSACYCFRGIVLYIENNFFFLSTFISKRENDMLFPSYLHGSLPSRLHPKATSM